MRIYYFSGASFPSPESRSVHVMKMCEAFGKAGHDVTLFAMGNPRLDHDKIFKSYDVSGSFKLSLSHDVNIPVLSGYKRIAGAMMKFSSISNRANNESWLHRGKADHTKQKAQPCGLG